MIYSREMALKLPQNANTELQAQGSEKRSWRGEQSRRVYLRARSSPLVHTNAYTRLYAAKGDGGNKGGFKEFKCINRSDRWYRSTAQG